MEDTAYKSGLVALVGRPNAGKSTLLNRLVGQKIAAVSAKPQTTRHTIRGILSRPEGQAVFLDTPGIHKPMHRMNRRMMEHASGALSDVDLVILVTDCTERSAGGDREALKFLREATQPVLLFINKIDRLRPKTSLLPLLDRYSRQMEFRELIPISAQTGENIELAIGKIFEALPAGPPLFADDELTDQTERVLVAEIIREKLLTEVHDELPYEMGVFTERFDDGAEPARVYCSVVVERHSQKAMIIGKAGERLKRAATRARHDLEAMLGRHLFIEIHVQVRERWRENESILRQMGLV